VLLYIFRFSTEKDLCNIRLLSKELKLLVDCDQVWKPRVLELINIHDLEELALGTTWKSAFQLLGKNFLQKILYMYKLLRYTCVCITK
jgi:hypothetical protein